MSRNAARQIEQESRAHADGGLPDIAPPSPANRNRHATLTVLIAVPALDSGAAERSTLDLVRTLTGAGHRAVVVSNGGALETKIAAAHGDIVRMNVASKNPLRILACAFRLRTLIARRGVDVVHALGRAPAWSGYIAARLAGKPFVTSWTKAFREQNVFKRFYNAVMVRGEKIVAASDELADLIRQRYRVPGEKLVVLPGAFDASRFDPDTVERERIERLRQSWGVTSQCRVVLVPGRMVRRKGHHLVVQAARHLKDAGIADFMIVFTGEDHGRTRYTAKLWDLIGATGTSDVIRMAGLSGDLPAALAAASVAVFASTQTEATPQTILAAQAMRVPVIASNLSAGSDVILAPPLVSDDKMTGLRVASNDAGALAASLIKLLSLKDDARRAVGQRGREWVLEHHDGSGLADKTLQLYVELAGLPANH